MHQLLIFRCDQTLDVFLFDEEGDRYGSLVGLNSDDVAYIQQNVVHAEIKVNDTIKISAEIFKYNLSNDELDVVHVRFTDDDFCVLQNKTESRFAVHFILKHSYFCNLHRSLDRLSLSMIKCLLPIYPPPNQKKLPKVNSYNLLDKDYQLLALKRMMACDSKQDCLPLLQLNFLRHAVVVFLFVLVIYNQQMLTLITTLDQC